MFDIYDSQGQILALGLTPFKVCPLCSDSEFQRNARALATTEEKHIQRLVSQVMQGCLAHERKWLEPRPDSGLYIFVTSSEVVRLIALRLIRSRHRHML